MIENAELIVCPWCGFGSGRMYWTDGTRHIEFTMKKIRGDIFECRGCFTQFEVSLSLTEIRTNIIDGNVINPQLNTGE